MALNVMLEVVMIEDPDGDTEFRLELTPEDGGGVAQLVPRLVRGVGRCRRPDREPAVSDFGHTSVSIHLEPEGHGRQ